MQNRFSNSWQRISLGLLLLLLLLSLSSDAEAQRKKKNRGGKKISGRVDINRAPAKELARRLPGIGPVKSRAIVTYRVKYGFFHQPEDLLEVNGIGPRTLEKMEPYLSFAGSGRKTLLLERKKIHEEAKEQAAGKAAKKDSARLATDTAASADSKLPSDEPQSSDSVTSQSANQGKNRSDKAQSPAKDNK